MRISKFRVDCVFEKLKFPFLQMTVSNIMNKKGLYAKICGSYLKIFDIHNITFKINTINSNVFRYSDE